MAYTLLLLPSCLTDVIRVRIKCNNGETVTHLSKSGNELQLDKEGYSHDSRGVMNVKKEDNKYSM